MIDDNEFFFVALTSYSEDDEEETIFPVRFLTKNYKKALTLTRCITDKSPEKRIFICNEYGDIEHTLNRIGDE
jgi:hypothetical protein